MSTFYDAVTMCIKVITDSFLTKRHKIISGQNGVHNAIFLDM